MKGIKYILIGYIGFFLMSCEENQPNIPGSDCPTYIEGWDNIFQSTFISRNYDFRTPCFNPNNPNEFAYIRLHPGDIYDYELRKHNIETGDDNLIANVNYCNGLSWAQTDWIIFNQTLYDVWKIKSDGTGLVKLTSSGMNMNPEWKPDGSAFIYRKDDKNIIADDNGNSIDTLDMISASWSENNKLLYILNPNMCIFDLNTQSSTVLSSTPMCIGGYEWLSDGVRFVAGYNGNLWLINTESQEKTFIKGPCGNKYSYFYFSICPTGEKLLVERIEAIMVDSFTYKINNDIVLMDIDGNNEKVIELPQ